MMFCLTHLKDTYSTLAAQVSSMEHSLVSRAPWLASSLRRLKLFPQTGINGTIMTYGQTGSGKTFTIRGDTSNFKHRGIIPRSLSKIFETVDEREETKFEISCSYVEIYNERFFDLLAVLGRGFSILKDRDIDSGNGEDGDENSRHQDIIREFGSCGRID